MSWDMAMKHLASWTRIIGGLLVPLTLLPPCLGQGPTAAPDLGAMIQPLAPENIFRDVEYLLLNCQRR